METYEITLSLTTTYVINAPCENTAIDLACEYFAECEPIIKIKKN